MLVLSRFLHNIMHLNLRRTSATSPCPEDLDKQKRLHKRNLLRLCYLIREENLPLENLIGSDESGCALMPVNQWRWTEKGAVDAFSPTKEDKRQFTFDIVHNAAGKVSVRCGVDPVCIRAHSLLKSGLPGCQNPRHFQGPNKSLVAPARRS